MRIFAGKICADFAAPLLRAVATLPENPHCYRYLR